MVAYRRNRAVGATYFFTATLRDRRATTLVDHINILRQAFRAVRRERPFAIDALVVLPEHLHAIWTLPRNDDDYPARWRAIKARFTRGLIEVGVALSRNVRGEYGVWQRRYWEHTIRDEEDFGRHVDYIHYNPVKHGWVSGVAEWPYSSFHRFVRQGIYAPDWLGDDAAGMDGEFGE